MLYVNFSVKHLKFALKWTISYFQTTLEGIFVTIATVKVKIIGEFYTLAIVLINLQEEIGEKLFSYFSLIGVGGGGGGAKKPLNARSSFVCSESWALWAVVSAFFTPRRLIAVILNYRSLRGTYYYHLNIKEIDHIVFIKNGTYNVS